MSATAKFAIGFFTLLFTAVAGLWLLGSKRALDETSLRIDAPPSEVFSWLTDSNLKKDWCSGFVRVNPIDEDPTAIGAKSSVVLEVGNSEQEFENCVLRNEPGKVFSIKSTNSQMVRTSVYTLEAIENDKTYFTYRVRTVNKGLGRLLAPFTKSNLQETIENDARKLKELIEQSKEPVIPSDGNLPVPESSEASALGG